MRGRLDVRSIEDIGDNTLSFAEVKALAAGDTLILEQAKASAELTRLQRLQRAYRNNQAALERNVSFLTAELARLERHIAAIEDAIARQIDTRGEKFSMTLAGSVYNSRAAAAAALLEMIDELPRGVREPQQVGQLGGLGITMILRYDILNGGREVFAGFAKLPCPEAHATLDVAREEPMTLIRQLEARLNGLDGFRAKTVAAKAATQAERQRAKGAIGAPFKHADALKEASARLAAIEAELSEKAHAQELQAASAACSDTDAAASGEAAEAPVGAAA